MNFSIKIIRCSNYFLAGGDSIIFGIFTTLCTKQWTACESKKFISLSGSKPLLINPGNKCHERKKSAWMRSMSNILVMTISIPKRGTFFHLKKNEKATKNGIQLRMWADPRGHGIRTPPPPLSPHFCSSEVFVYWYPFGMLFCLRV